MYGSRFVAEEEREFAITIRAPGALSHPDQGSATMNDNRIASPWSRSVREWMESVPEPPLDILYEDNHCLAIAKPAGFLSTHFQGKEETLDRMVKSYLKQKYQKPGNVFLGVVQRLDQPVSGVLLFARTSKAAARLAEQFRHGTVEKVYWAIVDGEVAKLAGTLEDWLRKDRTAGRVEVVEPHIPGGRQALLHFQRKAQYGGLTWLEVRPQTGRTHQFASSLPIMAIRFMVTRNTARCVYSTAPSLCTPAR